MTTQIFRPLRTIIAVSIATALAAGCVNTNKQVLASNNAAALNGQSLARTSREEKPSFAAGTAARMSFALVGALVAISEGNALVKQNGIEDPANDISASLVDYISTRYASKSSATIIPITGDDVSKIAASPEVRYVVDVRTTGWGFIYFPASWAHYRISYGAKATLYDTQTKTVVAEGFCYRNPEETSSSPTYDEMLANNAAVIKATIAQWGQECAAEFQRDMFPSEPIKTSTGAIASKSGT